MKVIKKGKHNIFKTDSEVSRYVSEMLIDLEKNGMDAVRKYSSRFDSWEPDDFELNQGQIDQAISRCGEQLLEDTKICQANVKKFAQAQQLYNDGL